MILHFIFVVKEQDRAARRRDYSYVQRMSRFFGFWIRDTFGITYDIQCDELIIPRAATEGPRNILQRINMHTLVKDHERRGKDIYHFYLTYFRPLWTDCTCEGYHSENFGLAYWQTPDDTCRDTDLFFAEKNCTVVSHEILHEMLRIRRYRRHIQDVHDIWTQHLFSQLPFVQYDNSHRIAVNDAKPSFLVMDTSGFASDGQSLAHRH